VSPLRSLTGLQFLGLSENHIRDVSSLAGLVHLRRLSLWQNEVEDVSPLRGMLALERLWLDGNPVEDVAVVARMTNLEVLGLSETRVADLSPLVANPGLGTGDQVGLEGLRLGAAAAAAVQALRERGVDARTGVLEASMPPSGAP
jgi:Leucine-rich repeat (LRR) protein